VGLKTGGRLYDHLDYEIQVRPAIISSEAIKRCIYHTFSDATVSSHWEIAKQRAVDFTSPYLCIKLRSIRVCEDSSKKVVE
jgi:hypothetical protein